MRRKLAVSAKAFALFLLLCCIAAVPAAAEEPTVSIMFVQDDLRMRLQSSSCRQGSTSCSTTQSTE